MVLGRQAGDGLLQLSDTKVSRRHAELRVGEGGTLIIRDQSTNGTFVNGERVVGDRPVTDNDVIRAGDSFALLRYWPLTPRDGTAPLIKGASPSIAELRATIALVGPSDASVLVIGESGTGKELVARSVHDTSNRSGPFVAVNCSAIPESLAESQLFGHAAGSFTGARAPHQGFFQQAHGGTLFLDEIGEMPLAVQAKLLRVLEERAVMPLGATRPVPVDVRIVAATHRELDARIADGTFRGDLHARLADIVLRTPTLRARLEDVLPLLVSALGPASAAALDPELVDALLLHGWPFNVRELLKIATELRVRGAGLPRLELSLVAARLGPTRVTSDVSTLAIGGLSAPLPVPSPSAPPPEIPRTSLASRPPVPPKPREEAPTPEVLRALVDEHAGNISRIARALGRSRRQVHRYLEAAGLRGSDDGEPDNEG